MSADNRSGRSSFLDHLKGWARSVKSQLHALYLACRDARVPWYAKALGALVLAYALSPVDLIPDFVPVLGYLDDIVLIRVLSVSVHNPKEIYAIEGEIRGG